MLSSRSCQSSANVFNRFFGVPAVQRSRLVECFRFNATSSIGRFGEARKSDKTLTDSVDERLKTLNFQLKSCLAAQENQRKTYEKSMKQFEKACKASTMRGMIPVYDAMMTLSKNSLRDMEATSNSINTICQLFQSKLDSMGVREISSKVGEPYDPSLHEAVGTVKPTDTIAPNTIVEAIETGYHIDDIIVRPSKVIVSSFPSSSEE